MTDEQRAEINLIEDVLGIRYRDKQDKQEAAVFIKKYKKDCMDMLDAISVSTFQ